MRTPSTPTQFLYAATMCTSTQSCTAAQVCKPSTPPPKKNKYTCTTSTLPHLLPLRTQVVCPKTPPACAAVVGGVLGKSACMMSHQGTHLYLLHRDGLLRQPRRLLEMLHRPLLIIVRTTPKTPHGASDTSCACPSWYLDQGGLAPQCNNAQNAR